MKRFALALVASLAIAAPAAAQNTAAVPQSTITFAEQTPAPAPVIGAPIGSPAYVIQAPKRDGQLIDIGQAFGEALAPYVNAAVQALILALVSWVLMCIQKRTGVAIDAGHRDALVRALQNQAGSLIADGLVKVASGKVEVAQGPLSEAAAEALKSIPDAADHLGLTPDYVAKRIVDMIPQTAAGAQLVASAPKAA